MKMMPFLEEKSSPLNIFIGFAAETSGLLKNAHKKLGSKNLDMIIANPVNKKNDPFGSDYNKVFFIDKNTIREFPRMTKKKIAGELFRYLVLSS